MAKLFQFSAFIENLAKLFPYHFDIFNVINVQCSMHMGMLKHLKCQNVHGCIYIWVLRVSLLCLFLFQFIFFFVFSFLVFDYFICMSWLLCECILTFFLFTIIQHFRFQFWFRFQFKHPSFQQRNVIDACMWLNQVYILDLLRCISQK